MINDAATLLLLFVGSAFLLLAAVGVVRMPDLFSRMQAATKAATLGAACMLSAVAFHFDDFGVTIRALLVVAFVFLTAPVAAHMIARAAYFIGVPLWEGAVVDELRGRYDPQTHKLASGFENPNAYPPAETNRPDGRGASEFRG
jgi:multicomponent Na+:H+ antiporter subunit G